MQRQKGMWKLEDYREQGEKMHYNDEFNNT